MVDAGTNASSASYDAIVAPVPASTAKKPDVRALKDRRGERGGERRRNRSVRQSKSRMNASTRSGATPTPSMRAGGAHGPRAA